MPKIRKIISGGQTGADRAAFDFALENGIGISGFIPKKRRAEDGRIPDKYEDLIETETEDYAERTRLNVENSDATLILSHGELKGGSLLTRELAEKCEKPFLHIDLNAASVEKAVGKTRKWLASINCENLNIAGPRASEDPLIYGRTKEFLQRLFNG
jgi:predicted Rossmann fold nucleotide-binding protein DprA/Smf involved in DNA uptake